MKNLLFLPAGALAAAAWLAAPALPEVEFERIGDHCYFTSLGEGATNVGAVVTGEGVLLIDPPGEPDLQAVLDALRKAGSFPVRWVVYTGYRRLQSSDYGYLLEQGAVIVESKALDELAFPPGEGTAGAGRPVPPRFVFEGRVRLFPDDVEIRIAAVRSPAVTAGDVIVCVPDEKVLYAGELFVPGAFPEIDIPGGGSAIGWLEGMKQSVAAVPLLKPAASRTLRELPPPPPELEKSPEETVFVVPGWGPLSNLKQMREMLEAAQKLRTQAARAASLKRSLQSFLASDAVSEIRGLANFESFAGLLFEAVAAGK